MASVRDLPFAIQWHEGMLLSPQHFQQRDLRDDFLLHFHLSAAAPYHWGVETWDLDTTLLVGGTFRIKALDAVLPDGLAISHRSEDEGELLVDLKSRKEEMQSAPMTVYLAVPAARRSDSSLRGDLARYESVEGEVVRDSNNGEGEMRIPRLKPRIRLMLGEQPPLKYSSMPLAQVRYTEQGFSQEPFIQPTLRVRPGSELDSLCQEVSRRLREKAVFLSEQGQTPSQSLRAPQLQEKFHRIHAMVAALPPFEALLGTGRSHPFTLYLALTSLVGHVAAVNKAVPPLLPAYDHNDLQCSYAAAQKYILECLEYGIVEAYEEFAFERESDAFSLYFDPSWRDRGLVLGVRRRDGVPEGQTESWIESCHIGSQSHIGSLADRRVRGIERRRVDSQDDLMPTRGVSLFSLTSDAELLVPGEKLIVRNPDREACGEKPIEVKLYVRKPFSAREEVANGNGR